MKNLPVNAEDAGDLGLIAGPGRSPGGGNGNPLLYSCLENPMDRGAWQATVHGVTKSQTWLSTHAWHLSLDKWIMDLIYFKWCIHSYHLFSLTLWPTLFLIYQLLGYSQSECWQASQRWEICFCANLRIISPRRFQATRMAPWSQAEYSLADCKFRVWC